MEVNEYLVCEQCVERGVNAGYQRAFKHLEDKEFPNEESLKEHIVHYVMLEICEMFKFKESDGH